MCVGEVVRLGQDAILVWMVWIGLPEKVTFEQRLEGGEGVYLMKFWGKNILGKGSHQSKALMQE